MTGGGSFSTVWGIITSAREETYDSLFTDPRRPYVSVPQPQGLDGQSEPRALGRPSGRNRGERRRGARPRADGLGRSAAQDVLERSADPLRRGRGDAAHHRPARRGRLRARRASHGGRLPQLAVVGRGGRSDARRPRPGLTPEMAAAVSKIMRVQDLILV